MPIDTWMSWSSGKDSAFTLFELQQSGSAAVKALVTTVNSDYDRVAMHSTRISLLKKQAEALGLPLKTVEIPADCSNRIYEERFKSSLQEAHQKGIEQIAFGDLFLEDIKSYRENLFKDIELSPIFPIWQKDTKELARRMVDLGFEAYLTCVDPRVLPASFAGRKFDRALLEDLPPRADPCGENGEFHTFVFNAPNFAAPIPCSVGEKVERDGFIFADVIPNSDSSHPLSASAGESSQ